MASRSALEVITQQLMNAIGSYSIVTGEDEERFVASLYAIAIQCQASVEEKSWENTGAAGSSFGLAMWIGMWPKGYVVEAGPGRVYRLVGSNLYRLSSFADLDDATAARDMEATGTMVVTPKNAAALTTAKVRHTPIIYRHEQHWGAVGLICSQGLTDNVPETQITRRLRDSTSSKQACEGLLQDALENGGSDNITIGVGRAMPKEAA